jgi:hypothetical protein
MNDQKRFSLRLGVEPAPDQPIFEDAPERLRYSLFQFMQQNVSYPWNVARILGDVLCRPELLTTHWNPHDGTAWGKLYKYVEGCVWWEVYNLIEAIHTDSQGLIPHHDRAAFRERMNKAFAEESIGWKLGDDGHLQRLLPASAQARVDEIFKEMEAPRFAPARVQVQAAYKAYNSRPRVDRDVCTNIFDALESVAKEVFSMPTATFGNVLAQARKKQAFAPETIDTLQKLYDLANGHFRHGMTKAFALGSPEVEFVYLGCLAGILLFVRYAKPSVP